MTSCSIAVNVTPLMAGSCAGPLSPSPARIQVEELGAEGEQQHHSSNGSLYKRRRSVSCVQNSSDPDKQQYPHDIQWMLSQLTPAQVETAARSSYEYLLQTKDPTKGCNSGTAVDYAAGMAARYLKSKKGKRDLALTKLQATLKFREDMDMDGLRLAFGSSCDNSSCSSLISISASSSSSSSSSADYHMLEKYLASGKNYVMSHDKEGRATHVFVPRKTQQHHPEWTLKESLYTMERAIACSQASDQSVNAILDFSGFSPLKHAPPMSLGKEFVLTLRQHYAGQLHKIFILDAPMGFSMLWKIFQPFLGQATKDKIVFCSGDKQKRRVLGEYYSPDQVAEWMMPVSTAGKNRDFDIQEYLYQTPFDKAFDE